MMTTRGEDYTSLDSIKRTGGLRPDEHWEANLAAARQNAEIAYQFGIGLVTFHAGFIPHDPSSPVVDQFVKGEDLAADVEGLSDFTDFLEQAQKLSAPAAN